MIQKETLDQPFILTVISGKGGVGKSMTSVNTSEMLSNLGYRVALIDADIGLSNCATLLNEPVTASVTHWINGDCGLEDLPHDCGTVTLVTGSDEPGKYHFQPDLLMDALDQVTAHLAQNHDFIVIDTPAGAGEISLWALDRAQLGTIVLVDEPTAISDVYRLCKYVYSIDPEFPFASIVNQADSEESAESTFKRFNTILNYFLQQQTPYFGFIPRSESIREAVKQQSTMLRYDPESPVLNEFRFIAQNIIGFAKNSTQQLPSTVH
jgi:flagellar biosynthesis protein FlhG